MFPTAGSDCSRRRRGFEQVSAGSHGAYHQTYRRQPTAQAKDVDVERISAGSPFGPSRRSQIVAAHHRTEPTYERIRKAGFDGRQRCPPLAEPDHAVVVEFGYEFERPLQSQPEALHARPDVQIAYRLAYPILHRVGGHGRGGVRINEQETGPPEEGQLLATTTLVGPSEHRHVVHYL